MQPRGQLWFELERMCRDFRAYAGLAEKESLEVLVAVLANMLARQQGELEQVSERASTPAP
jgi:hypothetical protein